MIIKNSDIQEMKDVAKVAQGGIMIGTDVTCITKARTILCEWTPNFDISKRIGIHDFNKFITSIEFVKGGDDDVELELGDTSLQIIGTNSRITYGYAHNSTIDVIEDDKLTAIKENFVNVNESFTFTSEFLSNIKKAGSILNLDQIEFSCKDGKMSGRMFNSDNKTKNEYKFSFECDDMEEFNFNISAELLLVLKNDDYPVKYTPSSIQINYDNITYWMAILTEAN